ncbi:alpha/beta fold hydrolase [Pseudofrankia inefficax]|uniref:Alpha/beta hydrolase n=1 Tax=Pseudofrankia inefficax (strain DSM 45817 / CECT 9037 / DDB 130130 / EuI1c) TaxID=298654 RepID=E3JBU0_PSEI1|nr:alpha/beta hydrolase [Pseudofrankia inefficax]ADP82250.1 hypothetical protein FraEuI1c_4251 [Pseudofrankia inefficax]
MSNDVAELKRFVVAHARAQKIAGYRDVLARVQHDGDGPGSWVRVWSEEAARFERAGRPWEASRRYALARFPFVDGPARQEAMDRCVATFEDWRRERPDIEEVEVALDGQRFRCWASGLSATQRRPTLLISGGIVTVKEQWAPMLPMLRRFGMAVVAADMPGAGENPLVYGADSGRMWSAVLDAVADRADVTRSFAIALSFSGHLTLRQALHDQRIRGVVTVGAPVSDFFTDGLWHGRVPRITLRTLAHMAGHGRMGRVPPAELARWALSDDELARLRVPVFYTACQRDEIIPASDVARLRRRVQNLHVLEHDDVHGAPNHTARTQLWTLTSLLRMRLSGRRRRPTG